MTALLAKIKAFSEREFVSSIGHAVLASGFVVFVNWLSWESVPATWWAAGVGGGAYAVKEIVDARRFAQAAADGALDRRAFWRKIKDGVFDLWMPLVASGFTAAVLTGV